MADFTAHAKSAFWTGMEVAALSGGAIIGVKFLNRDTIFRQAGTPDANGMIEPGPFKPFVADWTEDSFVYKHWGGIKFVGAAFAATYISNPWLKLIVIGIAFEGAFQELRELTRNEEEKTWMFNRLGDPNSDLNAKLKEAADSYQSTQAALMGGITDQYSSAVGAITDDYSSAVGMPMLADESIPYGVGAMDELY